MAKPVLSLSDLQTCKDKLSECSRIADALPKISLALGFEVTHSKLEKLFQKAGELPGDYLKVDIYTPTVTTIESNAEGLRKRLQYVKKLERDLASRTYFADRVSDAIELAFKENPIVLSKTPQLKLETAPKERMLTAIVSDCHFGLEVYPDEVTGNQYSWTVAARRMAYLAQQIASWKPNHRKETSLNLIFGGDIIAGIIHMDDAGVRPLAEQIAGATAILVQFIDYLRGYFDAISVSCVGGNHERIRKHGPQYSQRWNTYATPIYVAVAMAFRNTEVKFNIPKTGECLINLPGGDALALFNHGDIQPTISNVGKSLNIEPINDVLKTINSSGEFDLPVKVLCIGHFHTASVFTVGSSVAVVNGSVVGPDAYARGAINVRGSYGDPTQVLFESVPGHHFGDSRFVRLKPADLDKHLDKIILPPTF